MPACFSRIRRTTAALADFHATCNDEFATQGFGCRRGCRGVPNASPPRIQPVASSESSTRNKKRRRCAAKSPRNARSNALASCSAHARRTKKPLASVDARGFPIEKASESISRVLSLDDHLSRTCVAARLKHATRTYGGPPCRVPICACSGWGFPSHVVADALVRSYRTVSAFLPLPRAEARVRGGVFFSVALIRRVAPPSR